MSNNIFKTNSDANPFKQQNRFGETFIERYNRERDAQIKAQKDFDAKEKERLEKESLSIHSFPELIKNTHRVHDVLSISYMDKLKTEKVIAENNMDIDPDLVNLEPGWILYKKDLTTGLTIIKRIDTEEYISDDIDIPNDVFNALAEQHEIRTNKYIENYGYENWENNFKFPDWIEREAYLEEMEEEMEDITLQEDAY